MDDGRVMNEFSSLILLSVFSLLYMCIIFMNIKLKLFLKREIMCIDGQKPWYLACIFTMKKGQMCKAQNWIICYVWEIRVWCGVVWAQWKTRYSGEFERSFAFWRFLEKQQKCKALGNAHEQVPIFFPSTEVWYS